jgi:hypothetical protein
MKGKRRCYRHGGPNQGAPRGEKNGAYKSGNWTCEAIAERAEVSRVLKAWRTLKREMEDA